MEQSITKIYRADFRETEHTENYIINTTKINEQGILKIQDIILRPLSNLTIYPDDDSSILIIPLFGGVDIDESFENFIGIENFGIIQKAKGEKIIFSNPYENYNVQFLLCHFVSKLPVQNAKLTFFERNKVFDFIRLENIVVSAGIFDLRSHGNFKANFVNSKIFAYVIGGAFEFEDRLLEVRDGLLLNDVNEAEFEALSADALVLIFDVF